MTIGMVAKMVLVFELCKKGMPAKEIANYLGALEQFDDKLTVIS